MAFKTRKCLYPLSSEYVSQTVNRRLHPGHRGGTDIILERFWEAKCNAVLLGLTVCQISQHPKRFSSAEPGRVEPSGSKLRWVVKKQRAWPESSTITTQEVLKLVETKKKKVTASQLASCLMRCRLEWTDARLWGKPINQSRSASERALPETHQAIPSSSQQINTAPQPKANIMTIIKQTSLHPPHRRICKSPWGGCRQPDGTTAWGCKVNEWRSSETKTLRVAFIAFFVGGEWVVVKFHNSCWPALHKAYFGGQNGYSLIANVIS